MHVTILAYLIGAFCLIELNADHIIVNQARKKYTTGAFQVYFSSKTR